MSNSKIKGRTKRRAVFVFIYMRIELPEGILDRIMARIREERRLLVFKRRLMLYSIGAIGSFIALVPAFGAMWTELAQSGLAQFISLIFSDTGAVLAFWDVFVLSILESLPAFSIVVVLATLFVFLGSLKLLARDILAVLAPRNLLTAKL